MLACQAATSETRTYYPSGSLTGYRERAQADAETDAEEGGGEANVEPKGL